MRCSMAISRRAGAGAGWLLAAGALALAVGCTAVNPATGGREIALPGTAQSAVAAGWISGDAARQRLRGAATGAGVNALPAGSVRYYMDVQESKLREQLDGSGVGVVRKGDDVTLSMPAAVAFGADGAELNAAFGGVLDAVAALLRKYDKTVIEVAGHGDTGAGGEHQQSLSARRAAAVAAYLEQRGIRRSRLVTIGAGDGHPVASNDSAEGRARNRRVEMTLSPLVASGG